MKKITSKKSVLLRSFLLLPILAMLFYGFSQTKIETMIIDPTVEATYDNGGEIEGNQPSQLDLEEWKDSNKYAIWIDRNHVKNSILENYKPSDFGNFFLSYVNDNARSAKFPQPYQVSLSSKEAYKRQQEINRGVLTININNEGMLLVNGEIVPITEADTFIALAVQEEKIIKAEILTAEKSSLMVATEIQNILEKYEVAQIDILGAEQFSAWPSYQKGATKEQLKAYNSIAKKYNVIPIKKRKIPLSDLNTLETVYRQMNADQRNRSQPFPECQQVKNNIEILINKNGQLLFDGQLIKIEELPSALVKFNSKLSKEEREKSVRSVVKVDKDTPQSVIDQVDRILMDYGVAQINIVGPETGLTVQDGASRKQMAEYNQLAKHYNGMSKNNMRIKMKDVERLKYIYSLMSDKQRSDAEPFPNFPEPPPVPNAPGASTTNNNQWVVSTGIRSGKRSSGERASFPPPAPVIAISANSNEYSKELKSSIENYLEHTKSYEESVQQYRVGKIKDIESINASYEKAMKLYKSYYEVAHSEGKFIQPTPPNAPNPPEVKMGEKSDIPPPPPVPEDATPEQRVKYQKVIDQYDEEYRKGNSMIPPTPPEPKSPLDFIIDMVKKDAQFYYQDKKISSDKAIELVKKNKNLNIDARGTNGNRPTVRLSKQPIKIGSFQKSKSHSSYEYALELKEKGAQFYYKDNPIDAIVGIELLRNRKDLIVETLPWVSKQPEVKIYDKS